jgi:2-phospho-L-lactate guanylyltransferase
VTLWAIVPVKPLRRGKSRLSEVLSDEERADLNRRLLTHTLVTLSAIPEIEHVLVISRDQGALALARDYGARTLQENGAPQLNIALRRATVLAKNYAARDILVVPADLPLLTPEDVNAVLALAKDPPVVVVAPDRRCQGTNALFVSPAGLIEYEFGPGSFNKHCEKAVQAGARLEVCELPSLALDMDLPEDLQMISETLERYLSELEVNMDDRATLAEINDQLEG